MWTRVTLKKEPSILSLHSVFCIIKEIPTIPISRFRVAVSTHAFASKIPPSLFCQCLFTIYLLYRLYGGLHVMLDLKPELNDTDTLKGENTMGPFTLAVKAHALFQI